jgi:3-hydroxypropanoate dehydrogenase
MGRIVSDEALDTLFRAARRPDAWLARPVGDTLLRALWELVKLGPTSGDGPPAHLVFVRSDEAKARLAAALPAATLGAPVIAVLGRARNRERPGAARRDGALQAAALILGARALGLDCTPLWAFDGRAVDALAFPAGAIAADFLCALGYGDEAQATPEKPRAAADEACTIL